MIEDTAYLEHLLLDKTAEEYRRKGYEVSLEAQLDFLPGFSPDLVVRKGDETVVVEVKARSSLAANPKDKGVCTGYPIQAGVELRADSGG